MRKLVSVLLPVVALSFGCAKQKNTDVSTGVNGIGVSGWTGYYVALGPNLNNSPTVHIAAQFNGDQSFLVSNLDDTKSKVVGSFTDMPKSKAVYFQIAQSTFDTFGKTGTTTYFDYELNDDELTLKSPGGMYSFKKTSSPTNPAASPSPEVKSFDGNWVGADSDNNSWSFTIATPDFQLQISQPGERPVFAQGTVNIQDPVNDEPTALLTINSANVDAVQNLKMGIVLANDTSFNVQRLDATGKADPKYKPYTCMKQ